MIKDNNVNTKTYKVETTSNINIRANPTVSSSRIGTLSNGLLVDVFIANGTPIITVAGGYRWIKIRINGLEGYVASDFLTLVTPKSIKQELQTIADNLQNTINRLD